MPNFAKLNMLRHSFSCIHTLVSKANILSALYFYDESSGRLLLPGAPQTPPYGANRKGFKAVHLTALSSEASLSIVVISNY